MKEDETIFKSENNKENQEKQKENTNSKLVKKYSMSPLNLAVFERKINGNTFYSFKIQRTYPIDPENNDFGYTDNLRKRDLMLASKLFEKAFEDAFNLQYKTFNDKKEEKQ